MIKSDFIERQYLGLNKIHILKRATLAVFCFLGYYWREQHEKSGDLFLLLGFLILFMSILLLFILHFKTNIVNRSIILDGLWTTRKVKIDINSLVSVRQLRYNKFFLNKAVYNLHYKGKIRFFTRGSYAVELKDRDGQIYLIGSQRSEELVRVIHAKLNTS